MITLLWWLFSGQFYNSICPIIMNIIILLLLCILLLSVCLKVFNNNFLADNDSFKCILNI